MPVSASLLSYLKRNECFWLKLSIYYYSVAYHFEKAHFYGPMRHKNSSFFLHRWHFLSNFDVLDDRPPPLCMCNLTSFAVSPRRNAINTRSANPPFFLSFFFCFVFFVFLFFFKLSVTVKYICKVSALRFPKRDYGETAFANSLPFTLEEWEALPLLGNR